MIRVLHECTRPSGQLSSTDVTAWMIVPGQLPSAFHFPQVFFHSHTVKQRDWMTWKCLHFRELNYCSDLYALKTVLSFMQVEFEVSLSLSGAFHQEIERKAIGRNRN